MLQSYIFVLGIGGEVRIIISISIPHHYQILRKYFPYRKITTNLSKYKLHR